MKSRRVHISNGVRWYCVPSLVWMISMNLKDLRQQTNRKLAELTIASDLLNKAKVSRTKAKDRRRAADEAQSLAQDVAKGVQEHAHKRIASVVSRCLKSVFPDEPYTFQIRFESRRGKTEADLVLVRDGLVLDDPVNSVGLGVVDVASFALRLVRLVLARPKRRKVLVLDEPFKWLHGEDNRKRAANLLLALSQEFGIQIVMTTGQDWLRIGKIIELE